VAYYGIEWKFPLGRKVGFKPVSFVVIDFLFKSRHCNQQMFQEA